MWHLKQEKKVNVMVNVQESIASIRVTNRVLVRPLIRLGKACS